MAKFPRSDAQALADTEEQIRGVEGIERFYALPEMARAAFNTGDLAKASSYAIEALQIAKDNKDDWNYGNALMQGNTVLGLVALKQGNVVEARQYMLEAGRTPGSPQLGSFGPDFTLARELLARGERDAVLEFLTSCKGFWKMGVERLDVMITEVHNGGTF